MLGSRGAAADPRPDADVSSRLGCRVGPGRRLGYGPSGRHATLLRSLATPPPARAPATPCPRPARSRGGSANVPARRLAAPLAHGARSATRPHQPSPPEWRGRGAWVPGSVWAGARVGSVKVGVAATVTPNTDGPAADTAYPSDCPGHRPDRPRGGPPSRGPDLTPTHEGPPPRGRRAFCGPAWRGSSGEGHRPPGPMWGVRVPSTDSPPQHLRDPQVVTLTLTALHAAATPLYWVLPAPYRSVAALRVAVRACA